MEEVNEAAVNFFLIVKEGCVEAYNCLKTSRE